jgi:hypothetical protein
MPSTAFDWTRNPFEALEDDIETGVTQFHSSARILQKSSMEFIQPIMNVEMSTVMADPHEIKQMIIQILVQV